MLKHQKDLVWVQSAHDHWLGRLDLVLRFMEEGHVVLITIVTRAGGNGVHVRRHSCWMDHRRTELSGWWTT